VSVSSQTRLPAAKRRQALVDAALSEFSRGSYRGTTTADIAREAGISEPILYRHFASKRDLYFACLDQAWAALREVWGRALASLEGPDDFDPVMARVTATLRRRKLQLANLWLQALSEAAEDPVIKRYVVRQMREVHDVVRDFGLRAQKVGAVPKDRDPAAEAWIFLACGLLGSAATRLGGLMGDEDWDAIVASRRRWITGRG
jgi:AcrR family transcriptional regulator